MNLISSNSKQLVTESITEAMNKADVSEIIFAYRLKDQPDDVVVVSHLGTESTAFNAVALNMARDLFNFRDSGVDTVINGKARRDKVKELGRETVIQVLIRCTTYDPDSLFSMTNYRLNEIWYNRWELG